MTARGHALPVLAVGLVAGVLGVQVAAGGGDFVPARAADPCAERAVVSVSTGLEQLAEQLVLLGLDGAACELGVSRERLVLQLAEPEGRDAGAAEALRGGLLRAVDRLDQQGRLPKVSALVDEALDEAELNSLVERAVRAIPDGLVDRQLKTDDVLRRAIRRLDVAALLADLEDPARLESRVRDAVLAAARDELIDSLPSPF